MQQNLIERFPNAFEEIRNDVFDGGMMAAFRVIEPFPMAGINRQAHLRKALASLPF